MKNKLFLSVLIFNFATTPLYSVLKREDAADQQRAQARRVAPQDLEQLLDLHRENRLHGGPQLVQWAVDLLQGPPAQFPVAPVHQLPIVDEE